MVIYTNWLAQIEANKKCLTILIDPEKFDLSDAFAKAYIQKLPLGTTHIFVGGSTQVEDKTSATIILLKKYTSLPIILFPGDHSQLTHEADGVLFLSLLSGRNPKYLIEQQVQAAPLLKKLDMEVIPTAYILINGGKETAVQRVSQTEPIDQIDIELIKNTALAGQFLGFKCIYLEAGSGAIEPVNSQIIAQLKPLINIPLIVGGGIRSPKEIEAAFQAGADMVVVGTAIENNTYK